MNNRPPMPVGENKDKIFVDTRYKWFAEKYANQVSEMFENEKNQTDFDSYTWNGQKLRRELHSLEFCWEDFEKIADDYKCIITNAQIYRLYPTNKGTDRDKGYADVVSEMKSKMDETNRNLMEQTSRYNILQEHTSGMLTSQSELDTNTQNTGYCTDDFGKAYTLLKLHAL